MKPIFAAVSPILSATERAAGFDCRVVARNEVKDVYISVGRTEDFTMLNGAKIVNSGIIAGPVADIVFEAGSSLRYSQPIAVIIDAFCRSGHFTCDGHAEAAHGAATGALLPGDLVLSSQVGATSNADLATWRQGQMNDLARTWLGMNLILADHLPPEFAQSLLAVGEYLRSVGHRFPAAAQEDLNHATLH